MRILAFMNQKGGVGKTTTAVNVGSILAHAHGKRVLLIDLDPQANLSDHLGIDPNETERSVYDILVDGRNPRDVIQHVHGLDVIPATLDLSAAEIELASMMSRELRLRQAILPLADAYDFILMDCPPSLGLLTISALALAQEVIVPMEAEYLALRGLSQLVRTIDLIRGHLNPDLHVNGVIFCMYDGRTLLAQGVREEVGSFFPEKVFAQSIRKNIRLAEAPSHGLPIDLYDPRCAGHEDYAHVTEELLARHAAATTSGTKSASPATAPHAQPDAGADSADEEDAPKKKSTRKRLKAEGQQTPDAVHAHTNTESPEGVNASSAAGASAAGETDASPPPPVEKKTDDATRQPSPKSDDSTAIPDDGANEDAREGKASPSKSAVSPSTATSSAQPTIPADLDGYDRMQVRRMPIPRALDPHPTTSLPPLWKGDEHPEPDATPDVPKPGGS